MSIPPLVTIPEPFRARKMPTAEQRLMADLLIHQRWAAVATLSADGQPECSFVGFVLRREVATVLLHLSQLSPHTQNLRQHPQLSLGITQPECPNQDPQTLPRVSLIGTARFMDKTLGEYSTLAAHYRAKLPESAQLFEFGDFCLVEMAVATARFVGGFARAYTLDSRGFVAALNGPAIADATDDSAADGAPSA